MAEKVTDNAGTREKKRSKKKENNSNKKGLRNKRNANKKKRHSQHNPSISRARHPMASFLAAFTAVHIKESLCLKKKSAFAFRI